MRTREAKIGDKVIYKVTKKDDTCYMINGKIGIIKKLWPKKAYPIGVDFYGRGEEYPCYAAELTKVKTRRRK